jgi:hypothetical protein
MIDLPFGHFPNGIFYYRGGSALIQTARYLNIPVLDVFMQQESFYQKTPKAMRHVLHV